MHLLLNTTQLWVLIIGSLVPLVSYVLTSFGTRIPEPVKAAIHVIVAAVAAALYTAIDTHVFGWNNATAELVLTAIVGTLAAHHWLWKPSGISQKITQRGTERVRQASVPVNNT